jgi:hypothetical protein
MRVFSRSSKRLSSAWYLTGNNMNQCNVSVLVTIVGAVSLKFSQVSRCKSFGFDEVYLTP